MGADKAVLILGSEGQLAGEFRRVLQEKKIRFLAPPEKELDITDEKKLSDAVHHADPGIIINCAAYNLVDEAEERKDLAFRINSDAVSRLAEICQRRNIFLVHYSSDYVFDGKKNEVYVEEDRPNPVNVYGQSKFLGEEAVMKHLKNFLLFRLSWVFGDGRQNFLYKLSELAKEGKTIKVTNNEVSVPTSTQDVVQITLAALKKGLRGLFHLTNSGYCSRFEWAKYYSEKLGLNYALVPVSVESFQLKAKRPPFSAMSNQKISKALGVTIPAWQDAVDRFIKRF